MYRIFIILVWLSLASLFFVACTKDSRDDCSERIPYSCLELIEYDLFENWSCRKPYDGEATFYPVSMRLYEGATYYQFSPALLDYDIPFVFECEGINLCVDDREWCDKFIAESEYLGIVASWGPN